MPEWIRSWMFFKLRIRSLFWPIKIKVKRTLYLAASGLIFRLSPRIQDEYKAYQEQVWGEGYASVDFGEWLAGRIWPGRITRDA